MIEGDLPKRAKKLVQEWAYENKEALKYMWETKKFNISVQVDVWGYGISWNDFIDLSEYELYINSKEVATI